MNPEFGLGKILIALDNIPSYVFVTYDGRIAKNGELARGISANNCSIHENLLIFTDNDSFLKTGSFFQLVGGKMELTCDENGKGTPAQIGDFVNAIALENSDSIDQLITVEIIQYPFLKTIS